MTVPESSGNWNDLRTRVISGVTLGVIGLVDVWAGGAWFMALIAVVCGLMVWELTRMTNPDNSAAALQLGALGAVAIVLAYFLPSYLSVPLLVAPAIVGISLLTAFRARFLVYCVAILLAGDGFLIIRDSFGLAWMLWLVLVVIATDVAGYFAGRAFGGPKFWPQISPKKTWSGTVAGWIAAAVVGLIFALVTDIGLKAVLLGPPLAFGSQLGDIAESALKRKVGVKDSSALIPGHGGVMDRFDGMMGASLTFMLLSFYAAARATAL
ncbi:phosphatidate cytidylyltransferase [Aliiroseovarius sp. YM-037]|uniref:phosphatidate cytidylyltransferase n=1 Tax=Aliiroseovarius sp. YM-037 TaxID=3341728 RepID=UPI003A8029E8